VRLRPKRHLFIAPIALGLIGAVAAAPISTAFAATSHPIRPGVSVTIAGTRCTAGPVLRQKAKVYVAIPASCGGISPGKVQDGCTEANAPIGVPVQINGARHAGVLVYDSFARMQSLGTRSKRLCDDNDLALVQVDSRDRARVAPSIDGKHAPTGASRRALAQGRTLTLGSHAATAGASHQGGWEYDVNSTATLSATDVGSSALVGRKLLGMLTVVPGSMVPSLPISAAVSPTAKVYSFAKALQFLRKTPGFHHVSLVKIGEHV
jgi:hypothetical protein